MSSHPDPSVLAGFATGDLPLPPAVTVSAHLESCAQCRARVAAFEEAEGGLLEAMPPAPLAPGALDRAMARLDLGPAADEPPAPDVRWAQMAIPRAAARAGFGRRRWLAPGLWAAQVKAAPTGRWRTFLLRAPARTRIPTHGHSGGEMIAVLQGAFHDGRTYSAGDFAQNAAGTEHDLTVSSEGPCVCLIAVQGAVRWRGWARVITPLLGI
ncbi:MAG: ChrR family anti-sigma-E factor [Caulobacterales bacterium]